MKTKRKTKNKTAKATVKKTSRPKIRQYESHYLVILLAAFLLIEGLLITSTAAVDWQKGTSVLDMSSAVSQTYSDTIVAFAPITDTISGVNEFYKLAAIEMTAVLDFSENDPVGNFAMVVGGVYEFYQQASTQMASLLDMSSTRSAWGSIAGASVSTY